MFLPGARAVLLSAAGIASASPASPPQAGPVVRVSTEGTCPTASTLHDAFAESRVRVTDDPGAGAWTVLVTHDDAARASHISLRRPDGTTAFERDVPGDDCPGIAGAAAVVVEAYFLDVHLLEDAPKPAPPPPPKAAERVRTLTPPSRWLSLGVFGGGVFYAQPALTAWSGEVSVGARFGSWGIGASGIHATPTTQQTPFDHVRRTELGGHLDVSYRFDASRLWLEPGLAFYGLSSRVTALDLPGAPSTGRFDFGGGAFATGGLRLTPAVSVAATAAGALLVRRDRYAIEPSGVAARSPGERFFVGLGLRFDLPL